MHEKSYSNRTFKVEIAKEERERERERERESRNRKPLEQIYMKKPVYNSKDFQNFEPYTDNFHIYVL